MFGVNWSRIVRRSVTKTAKRSTRWATKPYRDAKRNTKLAQKRRKTWRSR